MTNYIPIPIPIIIKDIEVEIPILIRENARTDLGTII